MRTNWFYQRRLPMALSAYVEMPEDLYVRDRWWFEKVRPALRVNAVLFFYCYGILEEGNIEVGVLSSSMCHTEVLDNCPTTNGSAAQFLL